MNVLESAIQFSQCVHELSVKLIHQNEDRRINCDVMIRPASQTTVTSLPLLPFPKLIVIILLLIKVSVIHKYREGYSRLMHECSGLIVDLNTRSQHPEKAQRINKIQAKYFLPPFCIMLCQFPASLYKKQELNPDAHHTQSVTQKK